MSLNIGNRQPTRFRVGDRIRRLNPSYDCPDFGVFAGKIYTVRDISTNNVEVYLKEVPFHTSFFASLFELVKTTGFKQFIRKIEGKSTKEEIDKIHET